MALPREKVYRLKEKGGQIPNPGPCQYFKLGRVHKSSYEGINGKIENQMEWYPRFQGGKEFL